MAQVRKEPSRKSVREYEHTIPQRLFDPDPARCTYCSALVPEDCQHDYERRNGYRKGSRPAACLVVYQTDLPEGF